MRCAGLRPGRRARVRAGAPTADRDAAPTGDRFPGSRAACISGRLTLRLLRYRRHVHQSQTIRAADGDGKLFVAGSEARLAGVLAEGALPSRGARPARKCQDAWRWATDSGGSTGWPATMRWQDASYALTTYICQERGIIRPYGAGPAGTGGGRAVMAGAVPRRVMALGQDPPAQKMHGAVQLRGRSRSTNGGWANDQPLVRFRPILSAFGQAGPCWKCPDNFYTISLRNFSQESPPKVFGIQCATSAPLL